MAAGSIDVRRGYVLALLRVLLGGIFLAVWADNLAKGFYWPDGYANFLRGFTQHAQLGFYKDFVDSVVIPNAAYFSYTQMVVELVVMGLFVLAGFLTPVAGIVAAGYAVNLLLASLGNPHEWPGTYLLLIAVALAVAVGQAGRTWGVDRLLVRRRPRPRLPVY
jgi:uncharacterized membrane protein YphA (DoxX/SURF4 family)